MAIRRLLLCLLVMAQVGCGTRATPEIETPRPALEPGVVAAFFPDGHGHMSDLGTDTPHYRVVRDLAGWRDYWEWLQSVSPRAAQVPLPKVDFESSTLVVAAAGKRLNGDTRISFAGVTETDERLLIRVEETVAGGLCVVTSAETRPMALGLLPRTHKPIDFELVKVVTTCGG